MLDTLSVLSDASVAFCLQWKGGGGGFQPDVQMFKTTWAVQEESSAGPFFPFNCIIILHIFHPDEPIFRDADKPHK